MKTLWLSCGLLFVLSCCFVGWSGCAHLESSRTDIPLRLETFFPLKVGSCWTYLTWFQSQPQADLEVCIVKEEQGYFIDNRPTPSRWRFDAHGLRDGKARYLLKAPLKVGQKWMSVADVRTVERFEIIDVKKQIRVPAGVFQDCVVVRMEVRVTSERSMVNQMTFAPQAGIVEIRTELHQGAKVIPQSRLQLKSFKLTTS